MLNQFLSSDIFCENLILGGGLAGLSCSFHIGHEKCLIVDQNPYLLGHASSHFGHGVYWDEGPHVSFTKNEYVRNLLCSVASAPLIEFSANISNYYYGAFIPHPVQANLGSVPDPLSTQCFNDIVSTISLSQSQKLVANYEDWLITTFGSIFTSSFPALYTQKYWTCRPNQLTVDWVGDRISTPNLDVIRNGYCGISNHNSHYITAFRYSGEGGFQSLFAGLLPSKGHLNSKVVSIDLSSKQVTLASGATINYKKLISTIPLNEFMLLLPDIPSPIALSIDHLTCTSTYLVNITGYSSLSLPYHWTYVYDIDKLSTRITQYHLLQPSINQDGRVALQVEIYFSKYRPMTMTESTLSSRVVEELKDMGFIDQVSSVSIELIKYSNIVFDHNRRESLSAIFSYLEHFGLTREDDDLLPSIQWNSPHKFDEIPVLSFAGRYAQWKYLWSDDCLLRGAQLSAMCNSTEPSIFSK